MSVHETNNECWGRLLTASRMKSLSCARRGAAPLRVRVRGFGAGACQAGGDFWVLPVGLEVAGNSASGAGGLICPGDGVAGGAAAAAGLPSPQGPGKSPYPAHITIWQDALHPSMLDLPVIGKHGIPVVHP